MLHLIKNYRKKIKEVNKSNKKDLLKLIKNGKKLLNNLEIQLNKIEKQELEKTNNLKIQLNKIEKQELEKVVQRQFNLLNNLLQGPNPLNPIERYQKVLELIKFSLTQPEQRTEGWHIRRGNYITASNVATTLGKNKYQTRKEYLYTSAGLAERFNGNEATDFGEKFEPVATKIYELEWNGIISNEMYPIENEIREQNNTKIEIFESAFIPSKNPDCFFIGGSPDGLIKVNNKINNEPVDGYLIEIKCPMRRWPKENTVPEHYWIQMQIQLEVCNLEYGYFLDYKFIEFRSIDRFEKYVFEHQDKIIYKGCIVELPNYGQRFYSPIYNTNDDSECFWDFIDNTLESCGNFVDTDISFWVLVRRHYTKVDRDRQWLYSNLFKIYQFYYDRAYYTIYPKELT
jgi:hypothetical protein